MRSDEPSAFDEGFETIRLQPLGAEDAATWCASGGVPPAAVAGVLAVAAGNPLALLELDPPAGRTMPSRRCSRRWPIGRTPAAARRCADALERAARAAHDAFVAMRARPWAEPIR